MFSKMSNIIFLELFNTTHYFLTDNNNIINIILQVKKSGKNNVDVILLLSYEGSKLHFVHDNCQLLTFSSKTITNQKKKKI